MQTTIPVLSNTLIAKKIVFVLAALWCIFVNAQTEVTVNYTPTSSVLANPERGFYKHTEVHSPNYSGLNQTTLSGYRNLGITQILRIFYLEDFVNAPISSSYLSAMQTDFDKIRAAGLKCIVRFAYSDNLSGVKDAPKDRVLEHINQLRPIFQTNADVINVLQAGFIGSWGEWYFTDNFGLNPTESDFANRKVVLDAILSALPSSRMVQIRTPSLKQKTNNVTSALTQNQAFNGSNIARIGHHNDCFLASASDFGTYTDIATEYPYLEQETKYLPMGGETCAVNEPRSKCPTAIAEMKKFHWTYLNLDYNPNVISGFQADGCFSDIQNKLGYRFQLSSGVYPQVATVGGVLSLIFKIKNEGYAALYNQRILYLVLRNAATNQQYRLELKSDPRFWQGDVEQVIVENLTLPTTIVPGNYQMFLFLPDSNATLSSRSEYAIRFANDQLWENSTGYNNLLHTVAIQSSLGVNDTTMATLKLYPVPTINNLIAEYEGIANYTLTVFNALGQKIELNTEIITPNKIIINTEGLHAGIYFIQFQNDTVKVIRNITISR